MRIKDIKEAYAIIDKFFPKSVFLDEIDGVHIFKNDKLVELLGTCFSFRRRKKKYIQNIIIINSNILKNGDVTAFVIAHEFAHIYYKDYENSEITLNMEFRADKYAMEILGLTFKQMRKIIFKAIKLLNMKITKKFKIDLNNYFNQ